MDLHSGPYAHHQRNLLMPVKRSYRSPSYFVSQKTFLEEARVVMASLQERPLWHLGIFKALALTQANQTHEVTWIGIPSIGSN
jgi:hypothetical protein